MILLNPPHPKKRTTEGQDLLLLQTDEGNTDTDIPQGTYGDNYVE